MSSVSATQLKSVLFFNYQSPIFTILHLLVLLLLVVVLLVLVLLVLLLLVLLLLVLLLMGAVVQRRRSMWR